MSDLTAQAEQLRELHRGELLVLPNVWDAASATIVVEAGFPAVATASAAITAMLGYPDGRARRGRRCSPLPAGSPGPSLSRSRSTPRRAIDCRRGNWSTGCSRSARSAATWRTPTTDTGGLVEVAAQADWLAAVRSAADDAGVPIVINARVDVFLPTSGIAEADRLGEAVRRGRRYREAGADCIYPIGVRRRADLATLVTELPGPINGNTGDELDLSTLRELGVARVSYGPRFYRAAMADFATAVRDLLA